MLKGTYRINTLQASMDEVRKLLLDEQAIVNVSAPRTLTSADAALCAKISSLTERDPSFWTFAAEVRRKQAHAYFQYPAMMVPSMQRELIEAVISVQQGVESLFDPFAGSGTVLVEGLCAGLSVRAQDINPLAVLLCKAKTGSIDNAVLREAANAALLAAQKDKDRKIEASFRNRRKWFRESAAIELSKIRRAIRNISSRRVRQFLWVALAETVRLTSNSRTSTYKLHIRPRDEIERLPRPLDVFNDVLIRNLAEHKDFVDRVSAKRQDARSLFSAKTDIALQDSREPISGVYDLLVTSPPYGDNKTTVPYGQSAYLPLQWIDFDDIGRGTSGEDYLCSTHEIDRRSLGGESGRGDLRQKFKELFARSPSLLETFEQLSDLPRDRGARVLFFSRDLEQAIAATSSALRLNAYLIWTLGNRRVGNIEIPLDRIVSEFLTFHGAVSVAEVTRNIRSKRMAPRNNVARTMHNERVLIFRKCR